jgi:hypothetical protein
MKMIAVVLTAALLAPVAAAAQSAQVPPRVPNTPVPVPRGPERTLDQTRDYGYRLNYENDIANRGESPLPAAELERLDRANRISGLMEQGRCDEARALANAEGDRQMALRVRQLCRPRRS